MKKISTIVAVAMAMMLLVSNTYAASGSNTKGGDDSSDSAGGAGSGSDSAGGSSSSSGSATSGTNNVAPTRLCNGIWKPSPGMPWMWEIGIVPSNAVLAASNAQVVDLDMFGTPISTINYIHSLGKAMICYIDTQYEPDRPDSAQFPASVKGKGIIGWDGQFWVNISAPIVRSIMLARAKLAQSKGCDAIEWDDVDGYSNDNGFKTTAAEQISFNTYLATITHSLGMSVGLKNDVGQISDLVNYFDWALNEQCLEFNECAGYAAFIKQGKAVFGTEYPSYKTATSTFCPIQNKAGFSWLSSDLNLDGKGTTQCCSFNKPACARVSYQCTNANGTTTVTPPAADQSESLPSAASTVSSSIYVVGLVVASFFLASLL